MPKKVDRLASFRTEADEARFLADYDALRHDLLPAERTEHTVETAFGPTFVVSIPGTGVPVVFLHGHSGSTVTWYEFLPALAGGPPLHALDTPGDLGRSRQTAPLLTPDDFAAWLDQVLDGLGIERAHLVGISYGGWQAINQAARSPERVASLTLGEPAGIVAIRLPRFIARSIGIFLAAALPGPLARPLAAALHSGVRRHPQALFKAVFRALRTHDDPLPNPPLFTDDELRSVTQPTYAVQGSHSEAWAAADFERRLTGLVPHAQVEIAANSAHGVGFDRPELMLAALRGHLAAGADPAAAPDHTVT